MALLYQSTLVMHHSWRCTLRAWAGGYARRFVAGKCHTDNVVVTDDSDSEGEDCRILKSSDKRRRAPLKKDQFGAQFGTQFGEPFW